jgi:hypothetical protein
MKQLTQREMAKRSQEEFVRTQRERDGYTPFSKKEASDQWSRLTQQRVRQAMVVHGD